MGQISHKSEAGGRKCELLTGRRSNNRAKEKKKNHKQKRPERSKPGRNECSQCSELPAEKKTKPRKKCGHE